MGLLRLAVLGPPHVVHDGRRLTFALRKAEALLLYLAVEGGMHSRSKLAAFLWPDSEPHQARKALRNALALLRRLLAEVDSAVSQPSHLLISQELLGLDPQASFELDLQVVQHASHQAQLHATLPPQEQHASLVAHVEQALSLIRGPFLDGFWLGEDAPFDEWVQQQRQHWQVQEHRLLDRLSCWHEAAGELEQAQTVLTRWLAREPLQEEAYRRLMRVQLALGDASAAWQVYLTCRRRLAEALQVEPSAETLALAKHVRTITTTSSISLPVCPAKAERRPPGDLVAPLIGRSTAFRQLAASLQQVRDGQPQAVFVAGEAGIGKTRLAHEFASWARAQGAEVLCGQAFELGGRLPYQPLVEALRERLEAENAPEDLLEDLWLAELSRLLPELRVRYPDLPTPTQDELTAKMRLFEAVARLFDALAGPAPLLLLLDDLHWADGASLDLLRYLGRSWIRHGSRVLLLGTLRREGLELTSHLATQLADLGRDLPVSQVTLQTLSQAETIHLIEALVGEGKYDTSGRGEEREQRAAPSCPSETESVPSHPQKTLPMVLGELLFAHTRGQPLYLLETLKLLREREWLVPRLGADGVFRLEPTVDMATAVAQEHSQHGLLPPSVRALIQARLAKLDAPARQLVLAGAVLGTQASAQQLWQVAELGVQAGIEALEEAVKSGILREEEARRGGRSSYRFTHELIRDVVYTELGEARRQVLHQRALALLQSEGVQASELAVHALAAGEVEVAYGYSVQAGMEAVAVFAVEDAIGHFEQARAWLQAHKRLQTELSASEVERLYTHLGRAYANQNAWEEAQQTYEELCAYARQHQLPTLVSLTLNRLAILAAQQSHDKPQVHALLEQAWQVAQCSHDQRALAETEWNLAQITTLVWEDAKSALPHGQQALALARGMHDQELEAKNLCLLGLIYLNLGNFEEATHALEASLKWYAALSNEPTTWREQSLPTFIIGATLTQPLTNCATEAWCWGMLGLTQVHTGQVHHSIRSASMGLALSKEIKNYWVQVSNTFCLTCGLLDAGAYEEALRLLQPAIALVRTLPQGILFQIFLTVLGSTYQALQQWEEAQASLEEAVAMAEALDLQFLRVHALMRLCMNSAVAGEWQAAYHYALQAIAVRKSVDVALFWVDLAQHQYGTEALLRGGDERQAREEVQRLGERVGTNRRFRIHYLQSRARLSAWEGQNKQAVDHLREAAGLAADLGLPGEQWQIQAALARLHEAAGEPEQAHTAFGEAARIIGGLAEDIKDETLRSRFLAGPQIQQVVQHTRSTAQ